MDKLLEKLLQLDELSVFLAPGLLLELSWLLWFPVDSGALAPLAHNTFLAAVLALLIAAAIGLIIFPTPRTDSGRRHTSLERRRQLGPPDRDGAKRLFDEAEAAHLRSQLARGLGLAFGLLAAQIALRLALDLSSAIFPKLHSIVGQLPHIPRIGSGALTLVVGLAALALRRRARLESWLEEQLTSEAYSERPEYR